jgi:hypothetical protein
MGSCITENRFMILILNNLILDFDLQIALMERGVGDADKLLMIKKIRGELNTCFERLKMKSKSNEENFL